MEGLEIAGTWAAGGPPGTKRPDPQSPGLRVSPGKAILQDKRGEIFFSSRRRIVFLVDRNGPAVQAALVMVVEVEACEVGSGLKVALRSSSHDLVLSIRSLKIRFYLPVLL